MAKILIGCKLSNGVTLEIIDPPDADKSKQGLIPKPTGKRVVLKGANSLRVDRRSSQAVYPYAVTEVDESFWREWIGRPGNKEFDFIKNGLVFEAKSQDALKGMSKERAEQRTGTEPLMVDIAKDPRMPKGTTVSTTVEADPASVALARQNEAAAARAAGE